MSNEENLVLVGWRELDDGKWIYYDVDSSTGRHISQYQKKDHLVSVWPVYTTVAPIEAHQVVGQMIVQGPGRSSVDLDSRHLDLPPGRYRLAAVRLDPEQT